MHVNLPPEHLFPLRPSLPLPPHVSEGELFEWLRLVRVEGAPPEIAQYCSSDFRRFLYTYGLVRNAASASGKCLELGANPYFTTILLKTFTDHDWHLANYFGDAWKNGEHSQTVEFAEFPPRVAGGTETGAQRHIRLAFQHFNIEEDRFPYPDRFFDIVLCCEIIEHLLMDPCQVLREIRRILRPAGQLIVTTPNISRLENVAKMLAGANIYDPYSAYGPYGRHNREYNKHELWLLLDHVGFEIQEMFTADVHDNLAGNFVALEAFRRLIEFRRADLGQYIFLRAVRRDAERQGRPAWLYRSYPAEELA